MNARAVLFDLDGTLVDTNSLHIQAFTVAFAAHGYRVNPDRIALEVGQGGDHLIPAILGSSAYEQSGEAISKTYLAEYKRLCGAAPIRILPGARELLAALRARGLKLALVTSSESEQLDTVFASAGDDLRQLFDLVTTASDVTASKPAPELFLTAAEKLSLHPAQCIAVGDSRFDIVAARRAGLTAILLTGGSATPSTPAPGARRIFRTPGNLLAGMDETLHACSPQTFDLTEARMATLLTAAFDAACANLADGGAPIGAALFDGDGNLLSTGANQSHRSGNGLHHAEIVCLQNATGRYDPARKDSLLVSTLEPCVMCTGAAMESGIDTLLFALAAPADNGSTRVSPPASPETIAPRTVGHLRAEESRELFKQFLAGNPPAEQAAFAHQLLSLT